MRLLSKSLGPGVITGAADDDPSGIATYSVAGAQLGTKLLWTALLTWPLMAAVQSVTHDPQRTIRRTAAAHFTHPTRAVPENKPGTLVLF
jgi:hypothetical protein